jgi:hypothetical protein
MTEDGGREAEFYEVGQRSRENLCLRLFLGLVKRCFTGGIRLFLANRAMLGRIEHEAIYLDTAESFALGRTIFLVGLGCRCQGKEKGNFGL